MLSLVYPLGQIHFTPFLFQSDRFSADMCLGFDHQDFVCRQLRGAVYALNKGESHLSNLVNLRIQTRKARKWDLHKKLSPASHGLNIRRESVAKLQMCRLCTFHYVWTHSTRAQVSLTH